MLDPFPIPPEDTKGLRACIVLVAAAHQGLGPNLVQGTAALGASTTDQIGALVLRDCYEPQANPAASPVRAERALFFRGGTERFREDLPLLDFGDKDVLAGLIERAFASIPRETSILLGFSGHGSGIFGSLAGDERSVRRALKRWAVESLAKALGLVSSPRGRFGKRPWPFAGIASPFLLDVDLSTGSVATVFEIKEAIRRGLAATGRARVDLLFADACFDAALELWSELSPLTEFYVASEVEEPSAGWPYRRWLALAGSDASAEAWALAAVKAYREAHENGGRHTLVALRSPDRLVRALDVWSAEILADPAALTALRTARTDPTVHYTGAHDLVGLVTEISGAPGVGSRVAAAGEIVLGALKEAKVDFTSHPTTRFHGVSLFVPRDAFEGTIRDKYRLLSLSQQTRWDDLLAKLSP